MEIKSRFASFNEEEKIELCTKRNAKSTDNSTGYAVRLLHSFCAETGLELKDGLEAEEIASILGKFYMCVRNEKAEYYKLNTMKSVRCSLQRHFLNLYKFDIIHDIRFTEANTIYQNMLKKVKSLGKGDTNHHSEIEPEDMTKLFEKIDIRNANGLQELVWLNIMYLFVRRGRENVRKMKKDTFAIDVDASGKRFVYQVGGELDKNHGINDDNFETSGEGRMYETSGEKCPVRVFELYLSKLNPNLDCLWQKPRQLKSYENETVWYCNVPHGENHLAKMMSILSIKYNLSQRYTNHCLRVTSIQTLDDANIEGRHIIRVSGHKSAESVESYARKLSASKKRKISGILTDHYQSQEPCSSKTSDENLALIDSSNDISDSDMANLPSSIVVGEENKLQVSGSLNFAPVLNSCENITFNIYVNKDC